MKRFLLEFMRRGFSACGLGPVILAILYLTLERTSSVDALPVTQVCIGIFSVTALAFVAGGMNAVYQIERLPLMVAILIHGSVLYVSYLGTYLINDWLDIGVTPILAFTGIFAVGYLLIWAVILFVTKKNTEKLNEQLKLKQQSAERS